jgi:integrase
MAVVALNDEVIAGLTTLEDKSHSEFFDVNLKGLFVDVQVSGRKSFRCRIRIAGRIRVVTIGSTDSMSLAKAREEVKKLHGIYSGERRVACSELMPTSKPSTEPNISVQDFFLHHYLPYVKSYKRSWDTDESMIRVHINRRLGGLDMAAMKPPLLAQFVLKMRDDGYAPGTCNRALVLLRYGFTLAIRWGLPGFLANPMQDIRNLRDDNKRERFLSDCELQQLIAAVSVSDNTVLMHIVLLLTYTGARKREVLDARWVDVDWENLSWRIPVTKSGKVRHIPLSTGAQHLLRERQSAQAAELQGVATPFIFANPATLRPFVSIYYSWDTARKQAGLSEVCMHDLRHSFASFLVNAGRSLYEVQELLGHADIRTTSRYAHLSRERLNAAVEVIAPAVAWRQ